MKYRTAFLTLLTVFSLSILTLVLTSARLVKAAEEAETPYANPSVAPVPLRCTSIFEILDADQDRYITRNEAKKAVETTANGHSRRCRSVLNAPPVDL